jgi:hypothetical protein
MHFHLSDVQVLWSRHHHLHIWALLSVIRGLEIAVLPWMLNLWSTCEIVFVETGSSRFCHLYFSSAEIFQNNPSQCMTISFWQCYFCPLFLFTDAVFPLFVYAEITFETLALDTPNNVAVFVTDAPANAHQQPVLFQNWTSLPFSSSFTCIVTQHNH